MKKALYGFLVFMLALACQVATASVKITDIVWEKGDGPAKAIIQYQGDMRDTPELTVNQNTAQLTFKDATVWPKIDKKAKFTTDFDTAVTAYQFSEGVVRFRVALPAPIKGGESALSLILGDGKVVLSIPASAIASGSKASAPSKAALKMEAAKNDEMLAKIDASIKEAETNEATNALNSLRQQGTTSTAPKVDPMAVKDAPAKAVSSGVMGYIGKFVSLMGVMLLVLLGVLKAFKKGLANKNGKLGILTSSDALTFLKTTYIAPKKSLMMVKAHNQVFLIASSENGVHFLSEIKDVTGVIKEGEKDIAGANFDQGLETAEQRAELGVAQQILKEDITQSKPANLEGGLTGGLKEIAAQVRESVKISDQIKNKVQKLRPLQ